MRVRFWILLVFLFSTNLVGQEISFGADSIKDQVKIKTSAIYDNHDKTHFLLTKTSFGVESTCGTEITAYSKENVINRIVSNNCTETGRSANEFYFENQEPIFVYHVFEFFREKAAGNAWKNFKGLAGWESRYYFSESKLGFHSHKGRKDAAKTATGKEQKAEALALLNFVKDGI